MCMAGLTVRRFSTYFLRHFGWSEPSNDGSRPESVVLSLVTVQADARSALVFTDSAVIGGRRSLRRLTILPLCSPVFDYL